MSLKKQLWTTILCKSEEPKFHLYSVRNSSINLFSPSSFTPPFPPFLYLCIATTNNLLLLLLVVTSSSKMRKSENYPPFSSHSVSPSLSLLNWWCDVLSPLFFSFHLLFGFIFNLLFKLRRINTTPMSNTQWTKK